MKGRKKVHGRPLTHDERKAAEAAFSGKPFNPDWSAASKIIYVGILDAMTVSEIELELELVGPDL